VKPFIELTHRKSGNPVLVAIDAIVTVKAVFGGNKRAEQHGTLIEFFGSTLEVSEPYDDVKEAIFPMDIPTLTPPEHGGGEVTGGEAPE
jgi:hypothetical protein